MNETQELIIKGVIEDCYNNDFGRISTKNVAALSYTTEANIYRYFGNKDAIFVETYYYINKRISDFLTEITAVNKIENANTKEETIDSFYDIWKDYVGWLVENKGVAKFCNSFHYSIYYTSEVKKHRIDTYPMDEMVRKKVEEMFPNTIKYGKMIWHFISASTFFFVELIKKKNFK